MSTTSVPSPTTLDRRRVAEAGVVTGLVGALAWFAIAGDSIVRAQPYRYRDALVLIPWICMGATHAAVHALQRHRAGRVERWSVAILLAAMAFVAAGNLDLVLRGAVTNFSFPAGPLAFMLTVAVFGVCVARAGVLPAYAGVAVASSQLGTIALAAALSPLVPVYDFGSYSGALVHGLVMLTLAHALRRWLRGGDLRPVD